MDAVATLFVVLMVLALPAALITALVFAIQAKGRIGAFEAQVTSLSNSVASLADEMQQFRGSARPAGKTPPAEPAIAAQLPPEKIVEAAPEPVEAPAGPAMPLPPIAPKPPRDIEGMIGGRWSVILGGLATALGAVLLVRATIEAGLLGPQARIALAGIFSVALFAGGEWLRRRDSKISLPVFANADIPAILTGAGAIAAFAVLYAAYALYGFIGAGGAFVGLTLVGLAALALSAVHGPGLAALGVVGSYATPLLVSSDAPNLYALTLHVLVVTASTLGIAMVRNWLWLALAGVAGACLWTGLAATFADANAGIAGMALLAGSGILFAAAFGFGQHGELKPATETAIDKPAVIAFAALAAAFLVQAGANGQLSEPAAAILVSLIAAASAVVWPALAPVAIAAAVIALLGIAALDLGVIFNPGLDRVDDVTKGIVPPDSARYVRNAAFIALPSGLALLWGAWRAGTVAPRIAGWLASGAGAIAFLGLVIAYLRVAPFETHRLFGVAALALALGFSTLVETFTRLRPDDLKAPAPAAFAITSIAALSFGLGVTLDAGWMPLAFALASAGIAWIYASRPLVVMPWLALAAAVISAATIYANTPFAAETIGATPFFNRLIFLAGIPALAMIAGGEWLRRHNGGLAPIGIVSLGLAVAGLFVSLQIRHWLGRGIIDGNAPDLAETATNTLAALGFSLGLQRIASITGARLYANATAVAGAVSALLIAAGLLVFNNPLFETPPINASVLFNILLPAYLLPAIAAGGVAVQARPVRPRWYTLIFAGLSFVLLFMWVTLTIRHFWKGDQMEIWHSTSEAEVWTYSVAWLLLGVAVLAIGHFLKSQPIRIASGILIALTVTKVFVVDMSALTGAMRAFSFIGLGLSLLAIGRFYQRILIGGRKSDDKAGALPHPDR